MKSIKNLKISVKLYLLSGIALLGMLVLVIMSFVLMKELNGETEIIAVKWMPSCTLSDQMNTELAKVRLYKSNTVSSKTNEDLQTNIAKVEEHMTALGDHITEYGGYVTTTEGRGLYEALQSAWSAYQQVDTRMMNMAKTGDLDGAEALLKGDEGTTVYNNVSTALDNLSAFNTRGSNTAYEDSNSTYKSAMILTIVVMVVILVVDLAFSVVVMTGIRVPVQELEKAAVEMVKGNFDVDIKYEAKDELGVLALQFRDLIKKLNAIIKDEEQFMAKLSGGDLTVDSVCPQEYVGSFAHLLTSFRSIAEQLNDTMGKISESSEQVSNSADQVSSGAQALSQGATEQASSIQELAATINDISDRIKENADNAGVANTKVNTVAEHMNVSNEKMQDMIQAMSDINNSSNEIGKIIKTIEDIAFQTNILALNAAVEAARAGSAGKGFAVVADEVRNLAGKSAEASKNTAALIENSIRAVDNGTEIASETAKALVQAVDGAKEITVLVNKISEASHNQSSAISQITLGIDQISSVIQTNSATAEESAAASEELSSQAQLMREQVSKFRLKGSSNFAIASRAESTAPVSRRQAAEEYSPSPSYEGASYGGNDKY